MLAVTLLLDRDLGLGAPGVLARGRRFVTDRHGPAATNRAISAVLLASSGMAGGRQRRARKGGLRPPPPPRPPPRRGPATAPWGRAPGGRRRRPRRPGGPHPGQRGLP